MTRETGKDRAQRIQLDYHRARGLLYWSRWIAAAASLLLTSVYVYYVSQPAGAMHLSTGPISRVHAHFEADCQQCHSSDLGESLARDALQIDPFASTAHMQDACNRCHPVSGHFRSHLADPSLDGNCTSCHAEHMGRDFDLVAVASQTCATCHMDLNAVCKPTRKSSLNPIEDFSVDSHGVDAGGGIRTFRSLTNDPGRVKFDHAQHLLPGQVEQGRRGGFTHAMLSEAAQRKYAANEEGFVTLDCGDCHQPDIPGGSVANATVSEEGRFYAPIKFDEHCAACHELNYAGRTDTQLPLPHAAPWDEIESLLAAKMSYGMLKGNVRAANEAVSDLQPPGKLPSADADSIADLNRNQLASAVEQVKARCTQCHQLEDVTTEAILRQRNGGAAWIPVRWLQRGIFDHAAHRGLADCVFCHQLPNHASSAPSDQEHVMIGGPETCTPCHRPPDPTRSGEVIGLNSGEVVSASSSQSLQPRWASDNCILCHRYHWTRPSE